MAQQGREMVVPPTLKVFVSGHCQNCREAMRLAREMEASYPDLTVEVVNLDTADVPEGYDVFAVPTYALNGEIISLGNPRQSWLEQRIDNVMKTMGGTFDGKKKAHFRAHRSC